MNKTLELFEVGGCVRDSLLGRRSHDIDFAVEVHGIDDPDEAHRYVASWLTSNGFEIFVDTPQYFTLRARFPRVSSGLMSRWGESFLAHRGLTADFVLCRREGTYSDGRRPDWVELGTIFDDLARRDFTMNAMARPFDASSALIDPYGGQTDLKLGLIRCVGSPNERFTEDALRALRAIRFAVTMDMSLDGQIGEALRSTWLQPLLANIAVERRREELLKAMKHNTLTTLHFLNGLPYNCQLAIMGDGLWLKPTLET